MNRFLIILLFFSVTNCSLNKQSRFWTSSEKVKLSKIEKKNSKKNKLNKVENCKTKFLIKYDCEYITPKEAKEVFAKEKILSSEINPTLKISLYSKPINNSFFNNYDNNNGRINYDGSLKKISRFKFSKIENFHQYDPVISFDKDNIIFFDNKGSILKFDNRSKLIWKKNYYVKPEKKQNPILLFANDDKTLIVADSLAKYYALDIKNGELLWSKENNAPFNSQLKVYKDKFFVIDFKNILRSFSIKDGSEIWNVKTENSFVRSQKKLSLVIINEKIIFNNSLGDISAADIDSGQLIWQTPTQSTLVYNDGFFLKTSDIIADNNSIYFSNNKNEFFSIDISTGSINWKKSINSNLRSTIIDDYIFVVTLEGYLVILEKNSGKIIRSTDLFKQWNKKYLWADETLRVNVAPIGFIVGKNNIYLTNTKGQLQLIDIITGKTIKVLDIDNEKISRPFVSKKNLYIIKDNSIIKLN